MVTSTFGPTASPLSQPQGPTRAVQYTLHYLLLCCAAGQFSTKAIPGLLGIASRLVAFSVITLARRESYDETGPSSGTTEALVPGRPAAHCGTGSPSGTTGARSAAQRGRWQLKIAIALVALSVLPSTHATPSNPTAHATSSGGAAVGLRNPTAYASSSSGAATGLYIDDAGNIVDSEDEAAFDNPDETDDEAAGLYYDESGKIVDSEGEAVCDDPDDTEIDEFASILSGMGVDDPDTILQLVPHGMALAEFATYYAQLDPTERARLCDAESQH